MTGTTLALRDAPGDWESRPLWSMFNRRKDVGHPDEPLLSVFREHGVVARGEFKNHNQAAENRNIYQLIEPGWLVVNRMKAWQGSVGISFQRGIVSGYYVCFRPTHSDNPRYLNWLLRSQRYTNIYEVLSRGVRPGQAEIDYDDLSQVMITLPPLEEQRRIADFLDDQVARIDNIIAARREQAAGARDLLIAKTSDDFVDLYQSSPITRFSRFVDYIEQGTSPGEQADEEDSAVAVIKTSAISQGMFDVEKVRAIPIHVFEKRYEIRIGDVLVVRGSGSADLVADVAHVSNLPFQKTLMLSDLVYRLVGLKLDPLFATTMLLSSPVREQIRMAVRQGSGPAKVRGEDLLSLSVPVVSMAEQHRLATSYWSDRSEVDDVRRRLDESVDRLSELKRSLITAAVTGELDVSTADGSRVPA